MPGDGETAECVAHTPGGPTHVLLTDTVAEHLPGCNMAFSRAALLAVGGFDPRFRIAGDDVDICWRLQEAGGVLGFSPAAQVWHHRRKTIGAFWRQQLHYGRAEAELHRKWPGKYTASGHAAWEGRLYGKGVVEPLFSRSRIYHGIWGQAPFQRMYHAFPGRFLNLPMTPQWYLLLIFLSVTTVLGAIWRSLLFAGPVLAGAIGLAQTQAVTHARRAILHGQWTRSQRLRLRARIALLYRLQPLARFTGRYLRVRTRWRSTAVRGLAVPLPTTVNILAKGWRLPGDWLAIAERRLRAAGIPVARGTGFDRWDLELRSGITAAVRIRVMTEDFGDKTQIVRWRLMPRCPGRVVLMILAAGSISLGAIVEHHRDAAIGFAAVAMLSTAVALRGCGAAMATFRRLCIDADR